MNNTEEEFQQERDELRNSLDDYCSGTNCAWCTNSECIYK